MKLTQRVIETLSLPPGRSEVIAFDDTLPGFGLRVRATGGRTWVFQYKIGSRHRRVTLGNASAIKLEQARANAAKLHARVRLGHDVAAERDERRAKVAETFGATVDLYLPRQQGRVRPRSYVEIERYLTRYLRRLHTMQLSTIDRRVIATELTKIEDAHGPASANRARTCLSAFFAWAMRDGLVDANPVVGTERRAEGSRDRVLKDHELRAVWKALGDDEFGAIVRLLILTAQRREEIGGLRWSEITDAAIELPADRVKNDQAHTVPLSGPARTIIQALPRRDGREFVFGRGEGGYSGWSRSKARLDERIADMNKGPLPGWTLHDLRRTAVTMMAELGVQPHVIEAAINHISGHKGGVAGIYNKATYSQEKTTALARWAALVMAIVEGRKSNVTTLRGRA
jgi:integrase